MRSLRVAVALAFLTFFAGRARAEEPLVATRKVVDAVRVEPSPCLDARALAERIASWLGRDEIDGRLEGVIRSERDELVFTLRRERRLVGERRFSRRPSDSCGQWTAAVAL